MSQILTLSSNIEQFMKQYSPVNTIKGRFKVDEDGVKLTPGSVQSNTNKRIQDKTVIDSRVPGSKTGLSTGKDTKFINPIREPLCQNLCKKFIKNAEERNRPVISRIILSPFFVNWINDSNLPHRREIA